MGIGAYRHAVMLEHPAVVVDPPVWYCSLQPTSMQALEGLAGFVLRGRYHPGIGLETQIVFEGRVFQVQSVSDLDERHREIQVMAVEVVGRGTTPSAVPVPVPPSITVQPVGATIAEGESVTLTVEAVGTPPLAYQWIEDGVDIPGAVSPSYVTGPLAATVVYTVRVSNLYGSVTSAPATVTVEIEESPLLEGLVSYWTLDETSGTRVDSHGANHLTPSNSPGSAIGKHGNACDFEADSAQSLSHPDPDPLGTEDFTYALWFKRESPSDDQIMLIAKDAATGRSYAITPVSFILNTITAVSVIGADPFNLAWHFLVAWHDSVGDTMNVQMDDGPVASAATLNFPVSVTATPVTIGSRAYLGFQGYFDGLIDEVGLWRRVLTADERTALYNGGDGLTYPFSG